MYMYGINRLRREDRKEKKKLNVNANGKYRNISADSKRDVSLSEAQIKRPRELQREMRIINIISLLSFFSFLDLDLSFLSLILSFLFPATFPLSGSRVWARHLHNGNTKPIAESASIGRNTRPSQIQPLLINKSRS